MPKLDTIIAIKGGPDNKGRRKGVVKPRIEDEIWRRRLLPQGPFLKIFDVGRLATNQNSDLHKWIRSRAEPYAVWVIGPTIQLVATVEADTLAQRTLDWNTEYLSTDIDDWPTTFKDITGDLDTYEIEALGMDQYNPSRGLYSSTGVTDIEIDAPSANDRDKWFYSFPSSNAGTRSVKFTAAPSYASASVPFTFDEDCDLFLIPTAFWGFGDSYYTSGATYNYAYFFVQRPLSRDYLGDAGLEDYWDNKSTGSISGAGRTFLREYFINDPEGEIWKLRQSVGGTVQPIDAGNPVFLPGADFPTSGGSFGTPTIDVEGVGLFAGKLVGAIRKHVSPGVYEWYYMWSSSFWQIPDSQHLEDFEI